MSSDEELGACLRDARTAKQLKIADLAQETGLPERYLEALETGRFDELPNKAYARIYYANYARVLGLDTEELMLQWSAPSPLTTPSESRRRKFPWWSFPSLALALILAWLVVAWIRGDRDSAGEASDPVMAAAPGDATTAVPDAMADSVVPDTLIDTVTNVPSTTELSARPRPVEAEMHELAVRATGQTWIKIDADGETVRNTVLERGESLTVAARDSFHVWVTIPRSVEARLDGRRIDLPPNARNKLIGHRIRLGEGGHR